MAAALVRLKIEDMSLDDTGVPLDFDFPTLLAYEGGLIPVLRKKQPHFITGTAVGAGTQDATGVGYISHFATCPNAASHRKK